MYRTCLTILGALTLAAVIAAAPQPTTNAPYEVLKTARVGGEGGWDYIYADVAGRRLYIPRRGAPPVQTRLSVYNLDTLDLVGEIEGVGGNGAAVDPKSGHGFTSSRPPSMFDTKTMKLIKTIDVGKAAPDGIVFDDFNDRVYVFSHPTKDATVIDSKDGTVLGTIDLGGVPEQGVPDGKGMLYVVMQDAQGSVTAVDVKTMKAIAHYPLGDKGGCNGLAFDPKNRILFAACARSGDPDTMPPKPMMVVLQAYDGKILTSLPLAGGSDGAVFNPNTMEAFSSQRDGTLTIIKENTPTSFEVEQTVQTKPGCKTSSLDSKNNRIVLICTERAPESGAASERPPEGRGGRGGPGYLDVLWVGR